MCGLDATDWLDIITFSVVCERPEKIACILGGWRLVSFFHERVVGASLPLAAGPLGDCDFEKNVVGIVIEGDDVSTCNIFWVETQTESSLHIILNGLRDRSWAAKHGDCFVDAFDDTWMFDRDHRFRGYSKPGSRLRRRVVRRGSARGGHCVKHCPIR